MDARVVRKTPLRIEVYPVLFMLWRAFALIRDYARGRRRHTGGSSAAAGLLPGVEPLLFALFHDAGSPDDFSHAASCAVNYSLISGRSRNGAAGIGLRGI